MFAVVWFKEYFWKVILLLFKVLKSPAETLAEAPPPVKYLTVKVPVGAIPYVLVKIKFYGEYAVVNLVFSNGKPNPILSGLGVTSSSVSVDLPAPNCN